jgi:hypothetical protein
MVKPITADKRNTSMKQTITVIAISALLLASFPALAEHREGRHFEGREIHRFAERDFEIWRGGHWIHRRHEGRLGWWWIAAGTWYFYPSPVYPYPDPYTPPVVVVNQQPPVMVVPQAPVMAAPQPTAPAQPQPSAQIWYYCESAKSYYPYAPSCPEGWKSVPAQPPQVAPR